MLKQPKATDIIEQMILKYRFELQLKLQLKEFVRISHQMLLNTINKLRYLNLKGYGNIFLFWPIHETF